MQELINFLIEHAPELVAIIIGLIVRKKDITGIKARMDYITADGELSREELRKLKKEIRAARKEGEN